MFTGTSTKKKGKATKQRPRTIRLEKDDERWIEQQPHPDGFSGVVREAVKFYRKSKDEQTSEQRKALLGSVR